VAALVVAKGRDGQVRRDPPHEVAERVVLLPPARSVRFLQPDQEVRPVVAGPDLAAVWPREAREVAALVIAVPGQAAQRIGASGQAAVPVVPGVGHVAQRIGHRRHP
jgi:hypothetical protein